MTTPTPRPEGGAAPLNAATRMESTFRGFFHEPGHFLKDHAWVEHEGRWHVFYIRGDGTGSFHKQVDVDVGHASTIDFRDWNIHAALPVEGAPSVIRKDGTFYLYSNRRVGVTGRPGIVLATSTDLECWEVHGDNPVYAPNPELYSWPEPRHQREQEGLRSRSWTMTRNAGGISGRFLMASSYL